MAEHPELAAEQAYIDEAYRRLEETRREALDLRDMVEVGRGGTNQARWEREVFQENVVRRLADLHLGDASLCFGRIDRAEGDESFYVGRIAVAGEDREPLVVDWRAPVAEPFYRATGPEPLGLSRRRHFACRGQTLLGIDDEWFGAALAELAERVAAAGVDGSEPVDRAVVGGAALLTSLEAPRAGRLQDVVATIQAEQDEIIRADLPGILVTQGGPGTGKTVVGLHRAAYLLYTHRFPLEDQGVLVLGPNRLFLSYVEQVLPALGEAGVELAVLADLVPGAERVVGDDPHDVARLKGDPRMVAVLTNAVRDRERAIRETLEVGDGLMTLRLTVEDSQRIVRAGRRRRRPHNACRPIVERELFAALAASRPGGPDPAELRERVADQPEVREALEWMWPVLTPGQLLHDLFGSKALLASAAGSEVAGGEIELLHRPRSRTVEEVSFTDADVPLLDEAARILGPVPGADDDGLRTYGHLVVDEAQDLSPMELRMVGRRSLGGSMTLVGDLAQATGPWAHDRWDEVLAHLPEQRLPRTASLTVGYRLTAPIMALAARVLTAGPVEVDAPTAVRRDGDPPQLIRAEGSLVDAVVEVASAELEEVDPGNVAIIAPASTLDEVAAGLDRAGVEYGRATRRGLVHRLALVEVGFVKGLELDAAVVVEPSAIVDAEPQGLRALYVALTRATKRLSIVHERPLPAALAE